MGAWCGNGVMAYLNGLSAVFSFIGGGNHQSVKSLRNLKQAISSTLG